MFKGALRISRKRTKIVEDGEDCRGIYTTDCYDQRRDNEHKQNNNKGTRMVKDGED